MTTYIAYKQFDDKAACGFVNIPQGKPLFVYRDFLIYNNKPICTITSENAHNFFMVNDDKKGMTRGRLIDKIKQILRTAKDKWDRIWEDPFCKKYKRPEHEDRWLWNHDFYNAPVEDLKYILKLISE